VFPIHIPPLRERQDDIRVLAEHFLAIFARQMNKPVKRISEEVFEKLLNYPWPGNVRELQNVVERAVVLTTGDTLEAESLMLSSKKVEETIVYGESLKDVMEKFKMNFIRETIRRCGGNQRKASEILKIQSTYLSRLLHRDKETE
jgi:transcriptional regulator with PAS, ATPase and Fis domain